MGLEPLALDTSTRNLLPRELGPFDPGTPNRGASIKGPVNLGWHLDLDLAMGPI